MSLKIKSDNISTLSNDLINKVVGDMETIREEDPCLKFEEALEKAKVKNGVE